MSLRLVLLSLNSLTLSVCCLPLPQLLHLPLSCHQPCLIFCFSFLPHHEAYRILVPQPGIELASPCVFHIRGLPWWLSGKESTCQCRRLRFNPWDRKIPWRRKWQPIPEFLPGKSHGQRSLAGYSPGGHKRVGHD